MHVDELEYGWWEIRKRGKELPTTYKDKRNFVMHPSELSEYVAALKELKDRVDAEYERARFTAKVLETGFIMSFERRTPTLFTLCHVLEFFVTLAKSKLRMTQFLADFTRRRVKGETQ
jgi:hypothetical protein